MTKTRVIFPLWIGCFLLFHSGFISEADAQTVWNQQTSNTSNDLNAVTFDNSLFVAVGDNGTIRTSPDGVTWTARTSNTTNDLLGITFDNSLFVAVGDSGTIRTSLDGITWTAQTSNTMENLNGVEGQFHFCGRGKRRDNPLLVGWNQLDPSDFRNGE